MSGAPQWICSIVSTAIKQNSPKWKLGLHNVAKKVIFAKLMDRIAIALPKHSVID